MTKQTLLPLDLLPIPEHEATDSRWQPSWLHWLISALSGTVEIEKQTAFLKKSNEKLRKSNEKLRNENERLTELELKLDAVLPSSNSSLNPMQPIDKP